MHYSGGGKHRKEPGTVLYVSGEESEEQIKMRADRVCPQLSDDLYILAETNMENIAAACEKLQPKIPGSHRFHSDDVHAGHGFGSRQRISR